MILACKLKLSLVQRIYCIPHHPPLPFTFFPGPPPRPWIVLSVSTLPNLSPLFSLLWRMVRRPLAVSGSFSFSKEPTDGLTFTGTIVIVLIRPSPFFCFWAWLCAPFPTFLSPILFLFFRLCSKRFRFFYPNFFSSSMPFTESLSLFFFNASLFFSFGPLL